MTSIIPSDNYSSTRYRLRDQTKEGAPLDVSAILPKAPSPAVKPTAKEDTGNAPASSASLSSALWDMESGEPVRTTMSGETGDNNTDTLLAELQKWSQMTPAEMIRAKILDDKDLTEDSLAALPPEEREAILKEIAETIKIRLGIDTLAGGPIESQPTDAAQDSTPPEPIDI